MVLPEPVHHHFDSSMERANMDKEIWVFMWLINILILWRMG